MIKMLDLIDQICHSYRHLVLLKNKHQAFKRIILHQLTNIYLMSMIPMSSGESDFRAIEALPKVGMNLPQSDQLVKQLCEHVDGAENQTQGLCVAVMTLVVVRLEFPQPWII